MIRRAHENPAVLQLYKDYLGEPNSEIVSAFAGGVWRLLRSNAPRGGRASCAAHAMKGSKCNPPHEAPIQTLRTTATLSAGRGGAAHHLCGGRAGAVRLVSKRGGRLVASLCAAALGFASCCMVCLTRRRPPLSPARKYPMLPRLCRRLVIDGESGNLGNPSNGNQDGSGKDGANKGGANRRLLRDCNC